jgi:hypothetical protein
LVYEHVPNEIIKYIQISKLAKEYNAKHLPTCLGMEREKMSLTLEFDNEAH